VTNHFDHLDSSEREWLRSSRQRAARRTWLLIAVLVLAAIGLAWITLDGPRGAGSHTSTATADQRAVADGQAALNAWGRFAVTNNLADLRDTFWTNGPQYKLLARQATARKPLRPPSYTFTMSGTRVLAPSGNQRVLRTRVRVGRPGEVQQSYDWDVWMRRDDTAGGRWKLWTVQNTAK
jgi:hypothetical protein